MKKWQIIPWYVEKWLVNMASAYKPLKKIKTKNVNTNKQRKRVQIVQLR